MTTIYEAHQIYLARQGVLVNDDRYSRNIHSRDVLSGGNENISPEEVIKTKKDIYKINLDTFLKDKFNQVNLGETKKQILEKTKKGKNKLILFEFKMKQMNFCTYVWKFEKEEFPIIKELLLKDSNEWNISNENSSKMITLQHELQSDKMRMEYVEFTDGYVAVVIHWEVTAPSVSL